MHSDGELQPNEIALDVAQLAARSRARGARRFPSRCSTAAFEVRGVRVLGERHLKLEMSRMRQGSLCEAIAFRHFDHDDAPIVQENARVELAYRLDVNRYNGTRTVQLIVEHLSVM